MCGFKYSLHILGPNYTTMFHHPKVQETQENQKICVYMETLIYWKCCSTHTRLVVGGNCRSRLHDNGFNRSRGEPIILSKYWMLHRWWQKLCNRCTFLWNAGSKFSSTSMTQWSTIVIVVVLVCAWPCNKERVMQTRIAERNISVFSDYTGSPFTQQWYTLGHFQKSF